MDAAPPVAWLGSCPPEALVQKAVRIDSVLEALQLAPAPRVVVVDRRDRPGLLDEVRAALASHPSARQLRLVLATDRLTPGTLVEVAQAGLDGVLPLSATPDELAALLEHAGAVRPADPRGLLLLTTASFTVRTLEEAETVATCLASLGPDPQKLAVGLLELLVNAIEHGNLALGRDEKRRLLESGGWHHEIHRRLAHPSWCTRVVEVGFRRDAGGALHFVIADEGDGFDHRAALTVAADQVWGMCGRGIAMARDLCFDELRYRDPGNVVEAVVRR